MGMDTAYNGWHHMPIQADLHVQDCEKLPTALVVEAHGQAFAEAARAYFDRKGGPKEAWVDLAAETATVTIF